MAERRKLRAKGSSNPKVEDLVEILRGRIVNHELPPGAKLSEAALTEEFGASRPRIREAFGVLEDRGLIERIPNRGAVVTRLEVDKIYELFDVREVLEGLAVRLATKNAPQETWNDLVELFGGEAEQALQKNDIDFYVSCITRFRERIISEADNSVLAAQLDAIYDRTRVLIRRLVLVPGRAMEGLLQHQEILRAMTAGDAEKAEQLKRENIRSARDCFEKYKKFLL
ncbi:MAG: GntR family transcriptional regulator [Ectothiorhodospiraceae bacterium]|nr:GntR family transcriptional regulator [Ectothiorhodospiraceae bacterium]